MIPLPNLKIGESVHQEIHDDRRQKVFVVQGEKWNQEEVVAVFRDFRDFAACCVLSVKLSKTLLHTD